MWNRKKVKYCPVPANIALRKILDASDSERFAVVGLPCHIQGVRKAEEVNANLKKRVVLHLGLFCGYTMNFRGTDFLLRKYALNKRAISQLDYRGEGWPGYMVVSFNDGTKRLIPLRRYVIFQSAGFFVPWRCSLCCEQTNRLADISFGDAWLPEALQDNVGTSVAITRTEIGQELLQRAKDRKKVTLSNISPDRVVHMEGKLVSYKPRSRLARVLRKNVPSYNVVFPPSRLRYPPPPCYYTSTYLSPVSPEWICSLRCGVIF